MIGRIEGYLRHRVGSVRYAAQVYRLVQSSRLAMVRIADRSPYANIYYCCTQKTASQWLRSVLSDPIVLKYTGLKVEPYVQLGLKYASFRQPFPAQTIAAHVYVGYPLYLSIPKPAAYRTFFMLRDPRDIVVSWYFSARYSHVPISPVPEMRNDLQNMDREEGFRYIIDRLDEWGSFAAQRSWMEAGDSDPAVQIFRFEDLAGNYTKFLHDLFVYLHIDIPEKKFFHLCSRHTFRKYSGWREQGMEDQHSHYRKGIPGDWENHFTPALTEYFGKRTGELLEVLGYR